MGINPCLVTADHKNYIHKNIEELLKTNVLESKVCCLEELILAERWPLSLHTHSFIFFFFIKPLQRDSSYAGLYEEKKKSIVLITSFQKVAE